MPKLPKKFDEKYTNQTFEYPFTMTDEEKALYDKFMFAKKQYEELVAYFCNTSDNVKIEIDGKMLTADGKTGRIYNAENNNESEPQFLTDEQLENAEKVGYGRGPNGTQLPLSSEMFELLREKVKNVLDASRKFADNLSKTSSDKQIPENERNLRAQLLFDVKYTQKQSYRDASAIEYADEGEEISYGKLSSIASNVVIDVGDAKLDVSSGVFSSREKICFVGKDGKVNKGYFTANTYVNLTKKLQLDMLAEYCPSLEPVVEHMRKDPKIGDISMLLTWGSYDERTFNRDMINTLKDEYNIPDEILNIYKDNPFTKQDHNNLVGLRPVFKRIEDDSYSYENKGLERNTTVNQRNVAMSEMASLFGVEKSVAKSIPMEVKRNGQVVQGSFMKNAAGFDHDDITPDNPFFHGKEIKIDYDKVGKSNANLLVLDYICGNIDRHRRNVFYQFEKDKEGNPVLVGFQGIDNDMSFINYVPGESASVEKLMPIKELKSLPADTFDRLKNISADSIRSSLAPFNLTDKELNACVDRFNKVKDRMLKGKIERKEAFTKQDLDSFKKFTGTLKYGCTPYSNFAKIMDVSSAGVKSYNQLLAENRAKNKYSEKYFTNREKAIKNESIKNGIASLQSKVYMDDRLSIKSQAKNIDKLVGRLWSPGKNDIPEYGEMYSEMKGLQKFVKDMSKKKGALTDTESNTLNEKYKDVLGKIKKYLPVIAANPSKNDRKRIDISEQIMDLCITGMADRERRVNELNEILSNTAQSLNEVNKRYKPLKDAFLNEKKQNPDVKESLDFTIVKTEFESKRDLAGLVGNLVPINPSGKQYVKNLAKLCVSYEIIRLKEDSPKTYEKISEKFGKHEDYFDSLATSLSNDGNFKKLAGNLRPTSVLTPNAQKYLKQQLKTFNVLEKTLMAGAAKGHRQKKNDAPTKVMQGYFD